MKDPKRAGRYIYYQNGTIPKGDITFTKKYKVTSPYNKERDNPVSGKREVHSGTDIVGTTGILVTETPEDLVYKYDAYNGLMAFITFRDKSRLIVCHLTTLIDIKSPDEMFTIIGIMGTSGNSTGPHYHMEWYRSDGTKADALEVVETDKIKQL